MHQLDQLDSYKDFEAFQVASMTAFPEDKSHGNGKLKDVGQPGRENGGSAARESHGSVIPGFYALDLDTVKEYLAKRPELCKHLGPKETRAEWKVARPSFTPFPSSPPHIDTRSFPPC